MFPYPGIASLFRKPQYLQRNLIKIFSFSSGLAISKDINDKSMLYWGPTL